MTTEEYKKNYADFVKLYEKGLSTSEIASRCKKSTRTIRDRITTGIRLGVLKKKEVNIEKIDSIKKELKYGDEKRLVQQILKEKSRTELIIDSVKEAIKPIEYRDPEFKIEDIKHGGKEEEQACLVISDVHVGKKTKSYNTNVFKQRLDKLTKSVIRITELLRNGYKIDTLNIIFSGDIVDGEGIYPTQALHIDQSVLKQVFQTGLPEFSKQIILLSRFFKKINVHCVRGNHGRSGKFADETSNWDLAFYMACKTATENYKNIEWNISYDWNHRFKIYDWKFLLVHGNQIKMQLNIPHYGVTSKGMRWQGSTGKFDYLIMGHFHSAQMCEWGNFEYFMNGTFSSNDEFSEEVIGLMGSVKQLFFGVHPRKGVSWRYKIGLE